MTFDVGGPGQVLLSFPAWTPGSYEITNFARFVTGFSATAGDKALDWDKLDYDTWRIDPAGARAVTVRFDYRADTLDNAMAWSRPDFAFFNGTNLFPYPEGRGFNFPAPVTVKTQPGWLVATGMQPAPGPGSYREGNYHDLVDMPFFVGRIDLDSMQVDGKWHRLATYPAGAMTGPARSLLWDQIAKMVPTMAAVFQETPWRTYTTLLVFTPRGRRGKRAGALQLPRRHLQPGIHREPAPRLDHRPRDLPRLEREAAPARRHVAVRVRRAAGDALALGERGNHRLLRRPGAGARRRDRFGGVPRAHRREDGSGGRGAAHRAGGRLALHLDQPDRRDPVPVLSQGVARRASCWTSSSATRATTAARWTTCCGSSIAPPTRRDAASPPPTGGRR